MAVRAVQAGRAAGAGRALVKAAAYPAAASALVIAVIGALAWGLHQPWLFPSLGPTIFLQTVTPNEAGARPYNTLVGHGLGVAAGFLALLLCGVIGEPSAMAAGMPTAGQVAASALAVGLTILGQIILSAEHPPAAATTMLLTFGGFKPSWGTVGAVAIGVALVTAFGEAARWWHPGRQPVSG